MRKSIPLSMSDLDLITPPLLDEKEFSGDMSDDGDDEEGGKDAMDEEESHSASKTPSVAAAAAAQKPHLSAYLQGFASTYNNLTAKKAKERIKCIEVENPKVHQFAAGEKFFNVVKNGAGLVSVKKLRADWERLRHEYIVEARLTDNSLILGYVTCGKKNELVHLPVASTERFVMVPVANLAAFHPPSFDPASHFHVTRQDQRRELVTIDSPAGGKVSFRAVNFDPRFILKAAKASERTARPKKPAAAPDKNSRDLGESICNLSRRLILELQRKEELSSVPVLVEHSPHFKKLLAQIGPENFPVMRSEDTDGLRLLPYDIGSGQGRMAECLKNLRAVHDGVSTEHLHGRWDTDPILRALLIQSMAKQFSTLPATRLLRHSGKALSERNISGFMSEFTDSDHGCAFIADAIAAMTLARDIFAELVSLDHSLLRTAAPLIAFANYAERLGGLHAQEFIFDSEKADNAPNLRCALTGSVIVPGMAFYLICAKTRPKDSQSAVRTMVAVVAKAVHDADMRLYPVLENHSSLLSELTVPPARCKRPPKRPRSAPLPLPPSRSRPSTRLPRTPPSPRGRRGAPLSLKRSRTRSVASRTRGTRSAAERAGRKRWRKRRSRRRRALPTRARARRRSARPPPRRLAKSLRRRRHAWTLRGTTLGLRLRLRGPTSCSRAGRCFRRLPNLPPPTPLSTKPWPSLTPRRPDPTTPQSLRA